ncbi:MAG: PHB depolymerase family esterase [Phycisphaerae bacterium]|nr:PHB depolymerase family esterase [Phycisphaerae bacterium]
MFTQVLVRYRSFAMTLAIALSLSAARADVEVSIDVPGGPARRLLLHLPANPGPGPLPLVLGFHGGFGNAESFRSISALNPTSDARGFAVAYMDAGDGVWGDYRPGPGSPEADLAYVRAALDRLESDFGVDLRRVYATGLSNGGAFCFVLAAELNDHIAAVAPVGHNLTQAFVDQATPGGPMHILQIAGTADPLMPFNGGVQGPGDLVLSSLATMEFWCKVNGNGSPTAVPLPNPAADGTFSVRETYAPSIAGFELERIIVFNGGHTWPGGLQYQPESVIGLTSRDFFANDAIWEFFADKCNSRGAVLPGDLNCDGLVSVSDIGPFVLALTDPAAYAEQYPSCDLLRADCNCDGVATVGDIGLFVTALTGT